MVGRSHSQRDQIIVLYVAVVSRMCCARFLTQGDRVRQSFLPSLLVAGFVVGVLRACADDCPMSAD